MKPEIAREIYLFLHENVLSAHRVLLFTEHANLSLFSSIGSLSDALYINGRLNVVQDNFRKILSLILLIHAHL